MRRILLTALMALVSATCVGVSVAGAADLILNEYNAVDGISLLGNDAADEYWGRREGNGGDWFELVVVKDGLDARGWKLLVVNDSADPAARESFLLTFTQDPVWSNLRSGTIVTVSEDLGANVDEYQPAAGRWWMNVRASAATDGRYMTVECVSPACAPADVNWKVSKKDWQLTIKNAAGAVVFGPAGEGIEPVSGVGATDVFKLEEDPGALVTPKSGYAAGTSSTFGQPNIYSGGTRVQDFSSLRSVVPFSQLASVRINELRAHSDPGFDWVEIYNGGGGAVDIGGWFLSDSFADLTKYEFPAGTTIASGGYLVLDDGDLGFALSSACGDAVILSAADASGLTGRRDFVEFGPTENGITLGRFPDGGAAVVRMSEATPLSANWLPLVGPVVINEIMYHPADPPAGISVSPEFIELHNLSAQTVVLSSDYGADGERPWRITGGVDFDFAIGTSIPAGAFLMVVAFDPVTDPTALAQFRSLYGLSASTPIVGPYAGKLSDFSDRVRLRMPDWPEGYGDICGGSGNPSPYVPYVTVDEVGYRDFGEWPAQADGSGASLERISPQAPAGQAASWIANLDGGATPGAANSSVGPPTQSQSECMTRLDRDVLRLSRAQERAARGCLREWAHDQLAAAALDDCVRSDSQGRLETLHDRAEMHFADSCSGADPMGIRKNPFFADGDSAGMFEGATGQSLGLFTDVFGPSLSSALSDAADDDVAWCQLRGASVADRCLRLVVRGFKRCVEQGLGAGVVTGVADLIDCVGQDPEGLTAQICEPVAGTTVFDTLSECSARGVDLAAAFPACSAASPIEAATCLARSARCRACRTLDRARMLHDDCDLFDDSLSNASCP